MGCRHRLLSLLLAAALSACESEREPAPWKRTVSPPAPDLEWMQALELPEESQRAAPWIDAGTFVPEPPLRPEDLYVEIWHGGDPEAAALFRALSRCDRTASIRLAPPRRVIGSELRPPAEWELELRHREHDPRGERAARLLREYLRESCDDDARRVLHDLRSRRGLVIRPVAELPLRGDPGPRTPLVLVVSGGRTGA
jgi:hypothetical protein